VVDRWLNETVATGVSAEKMRLLGSADESGDLGRRLGWEKYTHTARAHSFVIRCRRAAVIAVESFLPILRLSEQHPVCDAGS
jgi:hypothetical protein